MLTQDARAPVRQHCPAGKETSLPVRPTKPTTGGQFRNNSTGIAYCIAALVLSASVHAAEHGSPDDAVALLKKAVTYIKTHGQEKAFADVNKSNSAFRDRDLYIVVGDLEGNMLAHGGNPRIAGKAMMNIRDADGRYFVQEIYALANAKG